MASGVYLDFAGTNWLMLFFVPQIVRVTTETELRQVAEDRVSL